MPRSAATAAYKKLSADDKGVYARKARRAQQRYLREVEAYKALHPGWTAPSETGRAQATDKQTNKRRKYDGERRRPVRAYDIFLRELKDMVPHSERMRRCGELWRGMDEAEKQRCQRIADEENKKHQRIATLPEEQQELPSKVRQKRVRTVTAKWLEVEKSTCENRPPVRPP